MSRSLLSGGLLVICLLASLAGVASGAPAAATDVPNQTAAVAADDARPVDLELTRTYHLTPAEPGAVDVTLSFRLADDVRSLVVLANGSSEVRHSRGFDTVSGGRYRWDKATPDPSVRLTIPANETNRRFGGVDFADAGEWALVSPYTSAAYWTPGADDWRYASDDVGYAITNRVDGQGYAGARFAYLGPHERYERTVDGQTVTVVVPDVAAATANGTRLAAALSVAASSLDVGGETTAVNVFVAPDPMRRGGLTNPGTTHGEQDVWVSADSSLTRTGVHEYVHTRQDFETTNRTRWLAEGSAKFYEWGYGVRYGDARADGFERAMASARFGDAVLADRHAWAPKPVDYRKGSRVVAALDARVRDATDGERSFDDVFRRLNGLGEPVTLERFKRVVADVAGTSLDDWVDRYVTTGADPDAPADLDRFEPPAVDAHPGEPPSPVRAHDGVFRPADYPDGVRSLADAQRLAGTGLAVAGEPD